MTTKMTKIEPGEIWLATGKPSRRVKHYDQLAWKDEHGKFQWEFLSHSSEWQLFYRNEEDFIRYVTSKCFHIVKFAE